MQPIIYQLYKLPVSAQVLALSLVLLLVFLLLKLCLKEKRNLRVEVLGKEVLEIKSERANGLNTQVEAGLRTEKEEVSKSGKLLIRKERRTILRKLLNLVVEFITRKKVSLI